MESRPIMTSPRSPRPTVRLSMCKTSCMTLVGPEGRISRQIPRNGAAGRGHGNPEPGDGGKLGQGRRRSEGNVAAIKVGEGEPGASAAAGHKVRKRHRRPRVLLPGHRLVERVVGERDAI